MTKRFFANISALFMARKHPEAFCLTFAMRTPPSASLFVNGTTLLARNSRVASLSSRDAGEDCVQFDGAYDHVVSGQEDGVAAGPHEGQPFVHNSIVAAINECD